eukprot:2985345-Prymnesium_polylepis.1
MPPLAAPAAGDGAASGAARRRRPRRRGRRECAWLVRKAACLLAVVGARLTDRARDMTCASAEHVDLIHS